MGGWGEGGKEKGRKVRGNRHDKGGGGKRGGRGTGERSVHGMKNISH